MNYFELFGVKPTYFLNLEQINKKFYELSRVLHPDKFQTMGLETLTEATKKSAVLNSAFKTLKDDEKRAQYLFELAHFNLDQTKKSLPPDLAEEYFNLQEDLEGSEKKIHEKKELIQGFSSLLNKEIQSQEDILMAAFKDWENANRPLDNSAVPFFTRAHNALQQKNYIKSMTLDLEKKWPM